VEFKKVRLIGQLTAVSLFGDSMLYIVMPIYYKEFGLTDLWQVGALLSVNRIIRIPIHPFVEKFYFKYPLEIGFGIGLTLTFISTAACGLLNGFFYLFLARILWGISWAFLKQAGQLMIIEATNVHKNKAGKLTGIYNGYSAIGNVIGMLIGGVFSEIYGVHIILIIFSLIALTANSILIINHFQRKKHDPVYIVKSIEVSISLGKKTHGLLIIFTVSFFTAIVFQGLLKSMLAHWVNERIITSGGLFWGLGSASLTSFLLATRWALEPFVSPWIGSRIDQAEDKLKLLMVALSISAILFLIILSINLPSLIWFITILLMLIASIMVLTDINAKVVDYSNLSFNTNILAKYLMISDIGAAVGSLFGFIALDFGLPDVLGVFCAIILMISAILLSKNPNVNTLTSHN